MLRGQNHVQHVLLFCLCTVKPRVTDTHLIWTLTNLIITDSLLCRWEKKVLTFSLNSKCLIDTPLIPGLRSNRAQWPLALNICSQATRKSYFFHTNHMLGILEFPVSEHWAPFVFP